MAGQSFQYDIRLRQGYGGPAFAALRTCRQVFISYPPAPRGLASTFAPMAIGASADKSADEKVSLPNS